MKKMLLTLITFILFTGVLFSSSWIGGYKVSLSGFHTDSITHSEHLSVNLLYSPVLNSNTAVTLYGGYAFSNLFLPVTQSVVGGLSYAHLIAQNHPLEALFIHDSALWAAVDVSVMRVLSSTPHTFLNVAVSPFSLFFGQKFITVGSLILTYNMEMNELDWGVKIIEVTHYLW